MAVGDPYDPGFVLPATPITPTPTDISQVGIGGVSADPSQIQPYQFPLLASQPFGGVNYPTFGEAPGLGGTALTQPVTAATPAPATTPGVTTPTFVNRSGSPHAGQNQNVDGGPSEGGTVTPSTQGDTTGGLAASGDTQASANGGSSASNTPTGAGTGVLGKIGMGLLTAIPGVGPVIGLGNLVNNLVNPPPTPAQIAADAAVSQGMTDAGAGQATGQGVSSQGPGGQVAPGQTAGDTSPTSPEGADHGGTGGMSGGAGDQGGQGQGAPAGGGTAAGGDATGGGAVGAGSPGAAAPSAQGGFIDNSKLIGHSPPPDAGYISARPGEYVINAPMTQKYGAILDAINKGTYDPANPPGIESGDSTSMSANGGAPFGASQQAPPGYGNPMAAPGGGGDNDADDNSTMLAGPQDPANTSPLMPFPSSMALSPDAALQRLAALPMDQRAALAQVTADPTIQGALLMILGPPFAQFIQAAQAFTPPGPGGAAAPGGPPGAAGAAPPPGADAGGGQQSMNIPSASSGAPGGGVSPGPGGPMPGPANAGAGPPPPGAPGQMPHAAGGPVHVVAPPPPRGMPAMSTAGPRPSYRTGPEGMPTSPTGYYGPHAMGGPVQHIVHHMGPPIPGGAGGAPPAARPPNGGASPPAPPAAAPPRAAAPPGKTPVPPMRPHAWGGPVAAQDVRYVPPPEQHAAPPGMPQQMPVTGLRKIGSWTGRTNLANGGHYEMPMSPRNPAGVG